MAEGILNLRGNDLVTEIKTLSSSIDSFIAGQQEKAKIYNNLLNKINGLDSNIQEQADLLNKYIRSATLMGSLSDESTRVILNNITGVINKALGLLFINDQHVVRIEKNMYRNAYIHYNLVMETIDGKRRTFKQSGSGLAQIISFLSVVCLIDARKGRCILVMDELLNGLHPSAKKIISNIMKALSTRFQFILVEYGLDLGKQYEVIKKNSFATVTEYSSGTYYMDTERNKIEGDFEDNTKKVEEEVEANE